MQENVVVRQFSEVVGVLEEKARDELVDGFGGVVDELFWFCHGLVRCDRRFKLHWVDDGK